MMRLGTTFSAILHAAVILLMLFGWPYLDIVWDWWEEEEERYRLVDVIFYSENEDASAAFGRGAISPVANPTITNPSMTQDELSKQRQKRADTAQPSENAPATQEAQETSTTAEKPQQEETQVTKAESDPELGQKSSTEERSDEPTQPSTSEVDPELAQSDSLSGGERQSSEGPAANAPESTQTESSSAPPKPPSDEGQKIALKGEESMRLNPESREALPGVPTQQMNPANETAEAAGSVQSQPGPSPADAAQGDDPNMPDSQPLGQDEQTPQQASDEVNSIQTPQVANPELNARNPNGAANTEETDSPFEVRVLASTPGHQEIDQTATLAESDGIADESSTDALDPITAEPPSTPQAEQPPPAPQRKVASTPADAQQAVDATAEATADLQEEIEATAIAPADPLEQIAAAVENAPVDPLEQSDAVTSPPVMPMDGTAPLPTNDDSQEQVEAKKEVPAEPQEAIEVAANVTGDPLNQVTAAVQNAPADRQEQAEKTMAQPIIKPDDATPAADANPSEAARRDEPPKTLAVSATAFAQLSPSPNPDST